MPRIWRSKLRQTYIIKAFRNDKVKTKTYVQQIAEKERECNCQGGTELYRCNGDISIGKYLHKIRRRWENIQ